MNGNKNMISFLICGAQKSGTSALHEYLREHPEISLSKTKELHIFDNESRDWSAEGIKKIDKEIEHYFDDNGTNKQRGEATPSSMWWKPAARRIWEYNPEMKLIAVLRNPITRAYSNWRMEMKKGREKEEMHLTLNIEEQRCRPALPHQDKIHSYISRGFYSEQIRRIWQFFPRENLLLIKQEELREKPEAVLKNIYNHINVRNSEFNGEKHVTSWNAQYKSGAETHLEGKKQPSQYIVRKLKKIYRAEIEVLKEMTGMDCSDWLK